MVSYEDILIRIRGQDSSGPAFSSAQSRAGALKTAVGGAVTAMSASMLNYAKDAVDSAMVAEQEWGRFGNAVNNNGGNWEQQSSEIKSWVREFSDSMGRSVADTRSAMTTFMTMGMSVQESQEAMNVTANYAAQMGISQEEAAGQIQKALMGNGRALKALGLDIKDYKDETTGAIDKQKLFADILKKTGGAADEYANTTTGKFQRMQNVLNNLKTDFGRALIDALEPLIPVVEGVLKFIVNLPGPIKTVGFAVIALGAGLGIIAGPLMSIIGLMEMLGISLPTISGLMGVLGAETAALSAEELALAAAEAGLTVEEVASAAAHASNGVALGVEGAAATGAGGAFGFLGAMELTALWPILAIIAAIAVFVVAVEQIGEAMGWWTDFGTMVDAIRAGVERLWSAFINSPQVQGVINGLKQAWSGLMTFLQPIFDWLVSAWNNLFKSDGAGSGGPDVVRMIIDFFGQLGNIASQVFGILQQGFQAISYVVTPLWNGLMGIINVFSQLSAGSISWENAFIQVITIIGTALANFHLRIGQLALQIGARLVNGIISYVRQIPSRLGSLLSQAAMRILVIANIARLYAIMFGRQVLNGIINYIRQLPGRVAQWMRQVPGRIASVIGAAVGAATNLAVSVVNAVRSGIVGVAQAVYNEFMSIPGKINSAVSSAVSAAANFGNDIKNAVLNALNIASPGIIQRKIAIEFADIPGRIGESNDYVYRAARDYAGNIIRGFNAPQMSMESIGAVRQNSNYVPTTGAGGRITIVHVHEGAVPVDARNMTKQEAQGVVTLALENIFDNPEGTGG